MPETEYSLRPVGFIHSPLQNREDAPKLGSEGAPDAWLEMSPQVAEGLQGIAAGDEVVLVTWLHKARRDILKVHPRGDKDRPLTGVFATRSPDRPNPLGLHRVKILDITVNKLKVGPALLHEKGRGRASSRPHPAYAATRMVSAIP
jgi:tRNA-Thr(GGU) m(6)t(6)A37 methyltransferase TsaA